MDIAYKPSIITVLAALLITLTASSQPFGLVLHGGAGTITKEGLSPERQKEYEAVMEEALAKGFELLDNGHPADEAVVETIKILEDHPLFNAGKGSVLNVNGAVEMDASIMLGKDLNAGAVAGVQRVRHPIEAARAVMLNSPHVLMSNAGADAFAQTQGLQMEDPDYFVTEKSKERLENAQKRAKEQGNLESEPADWKYGTVGVVALDLAGNLAAGTSTGGMTNKMHNRIGDSPIIGAGTYANNESCGVSCTGHGEYFIRLNIAHEVSALMRYKGMSVQEAGDKMLHEELEKLGGAGGLIALDKDGNISMPFNTPGMFRAFHMSDGRKEILMFKDSE